MLTIYGRYLLCACAMALRYFCVSSGLRLAIYVFIVWDFVVAIDHSHKVPLERFDKFSNKNLMSI